MTLLSTSHVSTDRGIDVEVRSGGSGPPLIWFHGLVGPASEEPVLESLAGSFTVHAPTWPGYGELMNEGAVEDMLDFALLGWDIVDGIQDTVDGIQDTGAGIQDAIGTNGSASARPHIVGHSFGAMIAAEMACVARNDLAKLVLVSPFGLWLDDHPMPDPFAVLPFQLTEMLFADPANAAKLLPPGMDMSSDEGLAQFMVANSRRLGTAGKVMFPIPNRRLSKRLYRLSAPTQLLFADDDQLITEPYRDAWRSAIGHAGSATIDGAGHMVNLEQSDQLAAAISGFLQP